MFSEQQVSVVVPAYNPTNYLAEAIRSVLAQAPAEILVVDDCSQPPIAPIDGVKLHRLRENRGPAAARDEGIRLLSTPWVAFIDCDDIWCPGSLQRQLEVARSTGADLVHGVSEFVGSDGGPDHAGREPRHIPVFGSWLCKRDWLLQVPIDATLRTGEDCDFYIRLKEAGAAIAKHDQIVLKYRQREGSLMDGQDSDARRQDFLRLLRSSHRRRRTGEKKNEIPT